MSRTAASVGRCRVRGLAVLLGLLASGGCSTLHVESDWNHGTRFETLRTWDWLPAPSGSGDLPASAQPALDERVRSAVAEGLAARGYPHDPVAPTFWVHPLAVVEDVVAAEAAHFYSMTPEWMRPSLRGTHAVLGQRGVLVVDVIDPVSRTLLWRGTVSGAVDAEASLAARNRRLREAVAQVLAGFPPR
ncbi:MAG: DUF4136 domain-containing protein [Deltaproteobacteria bacterium]|nr:DUF4136 domain-containing protein [Deltaproteobacteria bacterium]